MVAGASAQTITVTGSGFVSASTVSFNGSAVPTTYVSATTLQAQVPASALSSGQLAPVTVTSPGPGGGSSTAVNFPVNSPTPQVSAVTPTNLPQAQPATLTITGTGFEANSSVLLNGTAVPTTFVNSTTLQVKLTADQVQSLGSVQITINNPGPGGSTTTPVAVLVYPAPTVTGVSPASIVAGSPAQDITVQGTNFVAGSVIQLDATAIPTTFASATTLTAHLPASLLTTGRAASLTVQNPDPTPAVSHAVEFDLTAPTPSLLSLNPSSVVQGTSDTTLTLNGTGFEANSVAQWNGANRTTKFIDVATLRVLLPAADLATASSGQVTVNNPGPGGSTSGPQTLAIVVPPVITSVSPTSVQSGRTQTSGTTTTITINGTNFAANAAVTAGGQPLTITSQTSTQIVATLTPSQLYSTGTLQIVVGNPGSGNQVVLSQPATLNVIDPSAPFYVYPAAAQMGSSDLTINLNGSGFFADSVVQWNGVSLATTYSSSGSLSATIPAALLSLPGTSTLSVSSPENLGQTSSTQGFSVFIALPINALVWNSKDGLLYGTIAGRAGAPLGNSLVGIDPATGVVQRTIFVGSEPTALAISDDGTQAFVGLNGAGAVRQVDLQSGKAGIQWGLGGYQGIYNPPYTASGLAVLPGQPNAVAVYGTNGVVTIFDSGVARPKSSSGLSTYFNSNFGGLAFGTSASTLYLSASTIGNATYALTVDSTGIAGSTTLPTSGSGSRVQYDNGRLYFPNGIIADASTGNTLGQFSVPNSFSGTPQAVSGPVISDSTLHRAWVVTGDSFSASQVITYDETTFNQVSSLPISGVGSIASSVGFGSPADLVRWGQNGLAFHTPDQLYILHGTLVKDTSTAPADLQLTAQLPATVTTGTSFATQLQVQNLGTSDAQGAVLAVRLPDSLIYGGAVASQGSCTGNGVLYCDLGSIANGASATVTVTATPSIAGSIEVDGSVDAQSFDPKTSNNLLSATTVASGALFSPVPTLSSLSPNLVQAGSTGLILTLNGSGFTAASVAQWNGTALPTTLVSSTQLTATVDDSLIKALGWGQVTVASPSPGGGTSGVKTISVYSLLPVPATAMTWDPFTRKLYATLPSTATTLSGNSLVSVDPLNGAVGTPIQVGSEPNFITETTSGNFLYLGISGAKSLERFNMATQAVDATVPLVYTGYFGGPTAASGLATIPGVDNSVAVDNIGIIDISGGGGTVRANSSLVYNDAVFPDAGHAYTYDNLSSGSELYRYTVDSSGVHQIDGSTLLGMGGFSGSIALDQGLIYGSAGGIIDPRTTLPTQIAVLPLGSGPYMTGLGGGGVVPYAATSKSFNVGINAAGTWLTFLERFDTTHFVLEETLQFPTTGIVEGINGTRWGQDGLAYLVTSGVDSSAPSQIMVLRGPFVLPAESSAGATPTLAAVGSGTVAVGSGNQHITVTGSGFLPGASVVWGGVVHDTTFVDAQTLSIAVGASEVASAATVSVTCHNPGSPESNAVTVGVQ